MKTPKSRNPIDGGSGFTVVVAVIAALLTLNACDRSDSSSTGETRLTGSVGRTMENYGEEVVMYAQEFQLPPEYLLALIVLESSGRRMIPPRFEIHVYRRLQEVKDGNRNLYQHVTPQHLQDATDQEMKYLASSWGPFQLMGYKCILLDINIRDIRGRDAVYWGIHWINLTYGDKLREGKYKDAFHIHNTGRNYPVDGKPLTHDPAYVDNGLEYMTVFKNILAESKR